MNRYQRLKDSPRSKEKQRYPFEEIKLFVDRHGVHLSKFLRKTTKGPRVKTVHVLSLMHDESINLEVKSYYYYTGGVGVIIAGTLACESAYRHINYMFAWQVAQLYAKLASNGWHIILATIPQRHDLDENHKINKNIMTTNTILKKYLEEVPPTQLTIIDLFFALDSNFFLPESGKLNKLGEAKICELVMLALNDVRDDPAKSRPGIRTVPDFGGSPPFLYDLEQRVASVFGQEVTSSWSASDLHAPGTSGHPARQPMTGPDYNPSENLQLYEPESYLRRAYKFLLNIFGRSA